MVRRLINLVESVEFDSLESYMQRSRVANYYAAKSWHTPLLPGITLGKSIYSLSDLEKISELIGMNVNEVFNLTIMSYTNYFYLPKNKEEQNSNDNQIEQWSMSKHSLYRSSKSKVCPICIKEHGAWLLPWRFKPITACHLHKVILIENCSNCGMKIKFLDEHCSNCGLSISEMKCQKIEANSIGFKYCDLVWGMISKENQKNSKDFWLQIIKDKSLNRNFIPIGFRLLMEIANAIIYLEYCPIEDTGFTTNPSRYHRSISNQEAHEIYSKAFDIVQDWPIKFSLFLQEIAAFENKYREIFIFNSPQNPQRCNYLGTFKMRLSGLETYFSWLFLTITNIIKENYLENPILWQWACDINTFLEDNDIDPLFIKESQAHKFLGITKSDIQHLVKIRKLEPFEINIGKKKKITSSYFSIHDIKQFKKNLKTELSTYEASKLLGLPHQAFKVFISKGLFHSKHIYADEVFTFDIVNTDELKEDLNNIIGHLEIKKSPNQGDFRFLIPERAYRFPPDFEKLAKKFNAIKNQSIQAYFDPNKKGLKGIWMPKEIFLTLTRRIKIESCISDSDPKIIQEFLEAEILFSRNETKKILRILDSEIIELRNSNILVPITLAVGNTTLMLYKGEDVHRVKENLAEYL